jgi:hypothetical protein
MDPGEPNRLASCKPTVGATAVAIEKLAADKATEIR